MNPLGRVREGWDEVAAEETRLLRQKSAAETARHFLALQREFADWLRETEPLYHEARNAAMTARW